MSNASPSPDPTERLANSFGFEAVDPSEKAQRVRGVFDSVAPKYDLMNDLMSGGVHRLWKNHLISRIAPRPGQTLLDVAGGTGDIALRFLKASERKGTASAAPQPANVVVCDINAEMIRHGRARAIDAGRLSGIDWVVGDAMAVPLPDACVDVYTISFGLRNVTRIDQAIREAFRVLRPGGRFFCLEFSQVVLPVLDKLYDTYSFNILPVIGGAVTGDAGAYKYLVESIRRFPNQPELLSRIEATGFARARFENLTGGVAAIHSGVKI